MPTSKTYQVTVWTVLLAAIGFNTKQFVEIQRLSIKHETLMEQYTKAVIDYQVLLEGLRVAVQFGDARAFANAKITDWNLTQQAIGRVDSSTSPSLTPIPIEVNMSVDEVFAADEEGIDYEPPMVMEQQVINQYKQ